MHAIYFQEPIEENFVGHQCAEIWRDAVYAPFVAGKNGLFILDIGANIGLPSYYFSRFASKVYSIEPSREHFEVLSKMVEFNKLGDIIIPINKAIYIKNGEYPLFHNKNKTMYSLHAAVNDNSSEAEKVQTITIKDLFEEYKINKVDLLKLDIEGSETEILSHPTFTEVADKISTVVVERHAWSGRHENQLVEALKNAGFNVSTIPTSADLLVGQR